MPVEIDWGMPISEVQVIFNDVDLENKKTKWANFKNQLATEMESINEKWALYFHTASTITSQILSRLTQTANVMIAESALSITLTGISIGRIQKEAVEAFLKHQYIRSASLQALAFSMGLQLIQGQIAKQRAFQLKQYADGIKAFKDQYRTGI